MFHTKFKLDFEKCVKTKKIKESLLLPCQQFSVLDLVFFNSWNNMIKQRDDERYQFVCPCPCVRVNVTSECPVSI